MDYSKYLRTKYWRFVRIAIFRRDDKRCGWCHQVERNMEVHHKYYRGRGQERPGDLITPCTECHRMHHQKPDELIFRVDIIFLRNGNDRAIKGARLLGTR